MKKIREPKYRPKGAKVGPKLSFLALSQVLFIRVPLSCIG